MTHVEWAQHLVERHRGQRDLLAHHIERYMWTNSMKLGSVQRGEEFIKAILQAILPEEHERTNEEPQKGL